MIDGEQTQRVLQRISYWCFGVTLAIAVLSLLGWATGALIIARIDPDYIPIAPSTALCFIILCVPLLSLIRRPRRPAGRKLAAAGAGIVLAICLALEVFFFLNTTVEFERLGIAPPLSFDRVPAGHMSPITMLTFIAAASGVLLLVFSREGRCGSRQAAALLATLVAGAGFVIILGYLHGTPLLYGGTIIPVALPTAMGFVLMGLGLLAALGPTVPPVSYFTGPSVRSRLMRAFLPATIGVVLISDLAYKAALTVASNPALVSALVAFLTVIVIGIIVSKLAASLGDEIDRVHFVRKQAEEGLRFLASIVHNLPNAVLVTDRRGVLTSWNRGAARLLGYKAEEIIGKDITTLMPEEIAQQELDNLRAVLDAQGAFSGFESACISKDCRRVPVELTGVAIMDDAGLVRNYAFVMADLTDRKLAEQERLKGHVLESIGLLAGGLAHDFNNLLSAVIGNIHLAKIAVPSDHKAFNRLADAEQICAMAGDLTKRLLTFATGGDPVRTPMPLPPLVRDMVAATLKDSLVVAWFDLPDDLHAVEIDEGQIKQVIANLVVNAMEAMPQGGTLVVRGENILVSARDSGPMREGRYVKLSIKDSGVGIPAENLARIFDPYFSTKDTYSRKGLGLGLAVCYSVIKKHDGLITVASEAGKGTTYDIYLPAAVGR